MRFIPRRAAAPSAPQPGHSRRTPHGDVLDAKYIEANMVGNSNVLKWILHALDRAECAACCRVGDNRSEAVDSDLYLCDS